MMLTITEALAELKTLKARVEKKQEFILANAVRPGLLVDPMAKEGGQEDAVKQAQQSLKDMLTRIETIRISILKRNLETSLEVCGETKTVQAWLTWCRDILPLVKDHTKRLLDTLRKSRTPQGWQGMSQGNHEEMQKFLAAVVTNISELEVSKAWERIVEIEGTLDGKLSLHNATQTIEI